MSGKPILALYLLAWLSPALCYLLVDFSGMSIAKVLVTLLFLLVWHLAFPSFRRAVFYSLPIFVILLPFDLFFFSIYREPPGTPVLLSIVDSNIVEATDFMRGRAITLLWLVLLTTGIWLLTAYVARRGAGQGWKWYTPGCRTLARQVLVSLFVFMVLFAGGPDIEHALANSGHPRLAASARAADQNLLAPLANLRPIFPIGRLLSMGEFCREYSSLRLADQSREQFRYNAHQVDAPASRQIYVLVIGETARADRFAPNGFTRGLQSFLAHHDNIVPLSNIISPFTYTSLSVPTMLTPPVPEADGGRDRALSLVSAFREAGFKTYWISNQEPIGIRETEVSHFSREADETVFMNLSIRTMHKDGLYDEYMIAPLAKFLARKEPKQFFVLHLLGSHDSYERRYPPSFDVFQPSLRSLEHPDQHDRQNKAAVENSYDNAMRYTDYVLARIIDTLAGQHAVSALVYAADHGETLFDGDCGRSGHGSTGKQEFPVAALVWVSNQYKAQWPERFQLLVKNAASPITTQAILPTLLDLASIRSMQLDLSNSLVSALFETHTRWVNAPDPIDWDSATTRGPCRLLVANKRKDKGTIAASGGHAVAGAMER
jgi:glucan phosphoethanolaminetransferase (alkaline phosphatase superfamily)